MHKKKKSNIGKSKLEKKYCYLIDPKESKKADKNNKDVFVRLVIARAWI